ncbi:MAG: SdpI family protein [Janthinobacterium lividum]
MKRYLFVFAAVLLLTLGVALALYPQLPSTVPVHWNAAGEPDGWGARAEVLMHLPFLVGLGLLWLVLPKVSPKRFAVNGFEATWWFSGMAMVVLLGYMQCIHLWGAYQGGFAMDRAILGGLGLFFVVAGNVMGKVRRNFWLGVRTPWTLANDRVWYATHRLAARTMVAGGALAVLVALAGWHGVVGIAGLVVGALVPVAFSLVYYKKLEKAGTLEA